MKQPLSKLTEEDKAYLKKQYDDSPSSSGKTQYTRYLDGIKLTYREAVLAKCFECCGGYRDGRYDCEISSCPLYIHMPYHGLGMKDCDIESMLEEVEKSNI